MFETHLVRMKQWSSPKKPPTLDNSSNNDITTTQTPPSYSMSPPANPSSSLKRNIDSTYEDESPSKRACTQSKETTVTKRQLIPVVSRQETNAQLQILRGLDNAAPASRNEQAFVNAKEDLAAYRVRAPLFTGAETPFARHENGLSNWRSNNMEPPSSFMNDEGEDGLFPALGGMSSYALSEEDFGFAAEPQYVQKGIDDGSEAYQLDADGLPIMDDEPVPAQVQQPVDIETIEEESKKPVVVYDLDDSDDDADMDAFIAEANGTQNVRHHIKPMEQTESAESSEVVETPPRAPQISRVQNLDGVHHLVTSDGQVDQSIIETGATPRPDEQHTDEDEPSLDDDSPQEFEQQTRRTSTGNTRRTGKERGDVQPRDAETIPVDEPHLQIIDQNDSALTQSFKTQGYKYEHPSKRVATPPLPTSIIATRNPALTYNVNKTSASTSVLRAQELAKLAGSDGPVAGRDNCNVLNNYQVFYSKVINYIPDLPHWKEFEWSRRYWIAVLYTTKKPKGTNKAKDFMWMKGNCYSTISTIWYNYSLRTMEEDFVLTCRGELTDTTDQVAELDWFNQKFVVLRAIKTGTRDFEKIPGLTKNVGVVPEHAPAEAGEVIEILGD